MLSWAQALNHTLPFRPEWVALPELLQECVDQCHLRAREKNIRIKMELELGLRMFCDANLIRSILVNLLNNAIKFSPNESTVTLKVMAGAEYFEIQVIDQGTGLAPEMIARIEQQAPLQSRPGTRGEKGSGMGLKISQAFAARHGATLKIHSQPGEGSRFCLLVPQNLDIISQGPDSESV